MKYLYILYQYLVAFPIMVVLTLLTAILTIVCFPCKRSMWLHRVQSFWSRCCCYLLLLPVTVDGVENLDRNQSYVFVANHQSLYDVFVIYGWLPQIFKWLMKKELRKIPFVGLACKAAGHIFVDRKHIRAGAQSLHEVEEVLQGGVSTVIFPEGTRSQTGEVQPFKRGAFQVAVHLNLPIVPLSLSGLHLLAPKGAGYIHRTPLHMHIGQPVRIQDFSDEKEAIEKIRECVISGLKQ